MGEVKSDHTSGLDVTVIPVVVNFRQQKIDNKRQYRKVKKRHKRRNRSKG